MDQRPRVIATVINDVIYDQRMIRICNSLSADYEVALWGRKKSSEATISRVFKQRRFSFRINKGPLFYILYNIRIFFSLLVAKVDIIHSVDLDTLPAGFLVSILRNKRLVYDSHEYFTEVPELINRPLVRRFWLKLEQVILPRIKFGVTVGRKIADEYTAKYNVPFEVIRNCPVLTETNENENVHSKLDAPYLLYQGALNQGRGLEALIEAMVDLDIQLKIAGTGDIDEKLVLLTKEFGVKNKVSFLGMLKPEELPSLTQGAFAGINVSENLGLSYYYSLNNKFFDYIHAGIPAITNPFPEYKALNDKYDCLVFASATSKEIVSAVKLLLNNPDRYLELQKNTFLAKQDLHWKIEEAKLLKFYESLS